MLLIALIGVAWASWRAELRMQDRLSVANEGNLLTLTGTVVGLPATLPTGFGGKEGWRFLFHPILSKAQSGLPQQLLLSWYGAPSGIEAGQMWQLLVILKRPHGLANPGGNDEEAWMWQRNIGATGVVRQGAHVDTMHSLSLSEGIARWRAALLLHMQRALPMHASHLGVLQAIVVGEQRGVSAEDWHAFRRTGTSHLLAISGLHITLVAGIAGFIFAVCWRRSARLLLWLPAQTVALLVGLCVAVGYCLLAGFQIPAQRALLMLFVFVLTHISGRITSSFVILSWALFVVVLFDPWAVVAPGFWLSFAAVTAILIALRHLSDPLAQRVRLPLLRRSAFWQHWFTRGQRATKVQLTVSLMLVPITALFFGQVSLLSPLANAFAIPVFSFLVTPLALMGALSPLWLARILLGWAHQIIAYSAEVLSHLAAWPMAVWSVSTPPWWAMILALSGCAWVFWGVRWRMVGLVLLSPLLLRVPPTPMRGEFYAAVLDVGQGTAVFVQTAQHRFLYDTGPGYGVHADAASRVILPYLRARGIQELDLMVISHADKDHSGGAATLLRQIPVASLSSSLPPGHALLALAKDRGVRQVPCALGQSWEWDGVHFSVLHPLPFATGKSNTLSCTLRIATAHQVLLLPGDVEWPQELAILARSVDQVRANILVMPHHGSQTSSSDVWLDAVMPEIAIAQVGYLNRFHHPRTEVVARYQVRDIKVLRSDWDGAIEIQPQGEHLYWQRWREMQRRYWHVRFEDVVH
ncbi:MAG: DNA internalization-related competence protein ComEC/Rec2 [Ottowia sp.]|nr:DNA internalization-related competence protein ComEC/Rec2 [Ottowia sp.]